MATTNVLPWSSFRTHLVLCPRYIRQGQPYRFLVSLFQLARPFLVTATIHRDGVEIAKIEREVASEGVAEMINLAVSVVTTLGELFSGGLLRTDGHQPD